MITQGRKIFGLWLFAALLICCMSLTSCSENDNSGGSSPESEVEEMLRKMTLREKVGQLFFVRPEALDPDIHWENPPTDLAPLKLQEVN